MSEENRWQEPRYTIDELRVHRRNIIQHAPDLESALCPICGVANCRPYAAAFEVVRHIREAEQRRA